MELIAILEDDPRRIAAMRACLAEAASGIDVIFFEDAAEMIAWLGERRGDVVLISLDHDLPIRDVAGKTVDCGTGRQVADYLAACAPTCPVIVHSSNDYCAPGMMFALQDAGWPCRRVYPSDDLEWIASDWAEQVRRFVTIDGPPLRDRARS